MSLSTQFFRCFAIRTASLVAAIVSVSTGLASGAAPETQADDAQAAVQEALHREIYGLHADRRRLLEDAAKRSPEYAPAQWHRGYVRMGTEWRAIDSIVEQIERSPAESEYLARRSKAGQTVEDQLKLANWCRERKLPQQELAHLTRVLDLNPDQPGIRERLGLQNVNGEWLTKEEALSANQRTQKEAEALTRWRTELREIAAGLKHSQPERQQAAREKLAAIRDRHVFPAMETVLSVSSEEGGLAVIDAAAKCPSQEATDSLVRHAVFSAWPLVREAAAERLRSRPRESFVPDMIEEMYLPMTSQFQWASLPNGRFGYRHLIRREGMEQRENLVLDTEYSRRARTGGNERETLQRAFLDSLTGVVDREMEISRRNASQNALNQRLAETLNIATNQQLPADPQSWWRWWDQENDVGRQGQKQTRTRQEVRQVSIADRRPQLAFAGSQSSGAQRRAECFAAGTLVLTREGYRAIEQIQVGDLVLAQHPTSGELTFKPVVGTTVRPSGKLVKVAVGQEVFETSQGHLYWLTGKGWCPARNLSSGDSVHGLNGSQVISSVDEGSEAQTYNLVVADFHTYFVGKQRILSHDVTNRRPTNAILPGLAGHE